MPPVRQPNLAQRHAELQALKWPESSLELCHGRALRFGFIQRNRLSCSCWTRTRRFSLSAECCRTSTHTRDQAPSCAFGYLVHTNGPPRCVLMKHTCPGLRSGSTTSRSGWSLTSGPAAVNTRAEDQSDGPIHPVKSQYVVRQVNNDQRPK
jgi:hypothetical protein